MKSDSKENPFSSLFIFTLVGIAALLIFIMLFVITALVGIFSLAPLYRDLVLASYVLLLFPCIITAIFSLGYAIIAAIKRKFPFTTKEKKALSFFAALLIVNVLLYSGPGSDIMREIKKRTFESSYTACKSINITVEDVSCSNKTVKFLIRNNGIEAEPHIFIQQLGEEQRPILSYPVNSSFSKNNLFKTGEEAWLSIPDVKNLFVNGNKAEIKIVPTHDKKLCLNNIVKHIFIC